MCALYFENFDRNSRRKQFPAPPRLHERILIFLFQERANWKRQFAKANSDSAVGTPVL